MNGNIDVDSFNSSSINTPDTSNQPLQYDEIFKHLPVAVYTCNSKGYVTSFNKSAVKLWGRVPLIGKDQWCGAWKIFKPTGEPLPLEECPMARTLKKQKSVEGEEIIVERPDGTRMYIRPHPVPLFDAKGRLTGGMNTLIDITEAKIAEERNAEFAAIVESSEDAIISKSLDGKIRSWNLGAESLFGYTEKEIVGKHITILIPPDRRAEEKTILSQIKSGKKVEHYETLRLNKKGVEIPVSLTISPIKNNLGHVIGASKIARDISKQKEDEDQSAKLAAIVEYSEDAIISKSLDGVIGSWNQGAENLFGYTEAEILQKNITILIPTDRREEEKVILAKIRSGDKVAHYETIRKHKDGRELPVSLTVSPIKDKKGTIIGASKIARNISKQKEADTRLQRYADNLETLNSLNKVISESLDIEEILQKVTDITTRLSGAQFGAFFYNRPDEEGDSLPLYTLSGLPKEAFADFGMPGKTALFHPTFSGEGRLRVDDITQDERYGHDKPHFGIPAGHPPVKSFLSVPVLSKNGSVIGGLFLGHEEPAQFTKEHETLVVGVAAQASIALDNAKLYQEIKILNSKKDEFIGLASHELKTPLTSITAYLQVLGRSQTDNKASKFLNKSIIQVNKLTTLVSDLLDISKIEAGKLQLSEERFDIRILLNDVVELIEHAHSKHQITLNTSVEQLTILADPQRIEQVIINLLTNAIKYSPEGSPVEVSLVYQNEEVKIGVKDVGIGLHKDKLLDIFSRFYRVDGLSPHMSGLGIGLYLSKEIIERHKGAIWAESEASKGSTFWFTIPVRP